MELKKYQKQVLGDLDTYLKSLDESKGLVSAWSGYWSSKGLMPPQGYYDAGRRYLRLFLDYQRRF